MAVHSKVSICNLSLALLGAHAIRNFDETNKRARMADALYESQKDYLLTKFDWGFARKFRKLNQQDLPEDQVPDGMYPYLLPSDCRIVRDVYPRGTRDKWYVMERHIYSSIDSQNTNNDRISIFYTSNSTPVTHFSDTFVDILALGLAIKMGPAITQDKALVRALSELYKMEYPEAIEPDANQDNYYREPDEDPNYDSFVNPDFAQVIL